MRPPSPRTKSFVWYIENALANISFFKNPPKAGNDPNLLTFSVREIRNGTMTVLKLRVTIAKHGGQFVVGTGCLESGTLH